MGEFDAVTILTGEFDTRGLQIFVGNEPQPRIRINNDGFFIGDGLIIPIDVTDPLVTQQDLQAAVDLIIDASPTSLNTLNELANALGDDPNFATAVATAINNEAATRAFADNVLDTAITTVEDNLATETAARIAADTAESNARIAADNFLLAELEEHAAIPDNLVVSQTNPGLTSPGLWIELNPDNSVKTFWVENGA